MNKVAGAEEVTSDLKALKELAHIAYRSGNYANMSETTMLNIMLSARDLGISPYKALNGGFYVVNGKIAMSTSLMTDRIRKEGHSVKITEWTSKSCTIIGIRKDNGDSVKLEFTWDDAVAAGLTGSPTWKKYPKAMIYNRAMSMLARVLFPDVVGNCYSEDEGEEIARGFKPKKQELKEVEIPRASLVELEEEIKKEIPLEPVSLLGEYLEYCESKVSKPMEEVVERWLFNPEPFKEHYLKWAAKKLMGQKSDGEVQVN
jgi:hypothetical protein